LVHGPQFIGRSYQSVRRRSKRGNSTQLSSRAASQSTMQSSQSAQEQVKVNSSDGHSGGSQNTTAGALPPIGSNIQQALSGRRALPFQADFTKGSFGAFQL